MGNDDVFIFSSITKKPHKQTNKHTHTQTICNECAFFCLFPSCIKYDTMINIKKSVFKRTDNYIFVGNKALGISIV